MTTEDLLKINPYSGEFEPSYEVKLEKFEGPLDLLLYLIKKDEIDIYDIPIARITRQYLEYVELMQMLNLDIAGEFILMAATLINIKSRMLLPRNEEEEADDPREALIMALLEYEKYKKAALNMREHEEAERRFMKREDFSYLDLAPEETFTLEATIFDLMKAFKEAMENLEREAYHSVKVEEVHIEDRIARIEKILSAKDYATFRELFSDNPTRLVLVVTLLAILELIKANRLRVRQAAPFGEIRVYSRHDD
ncbi:MAG: segregation/condensation protein A [candidate division Zixibacteria bacterium]|jgi:segregation and condensation protein A|nr:segregation/condensation protein A [candidate division Zixibacteria bacterium]